jgi:UDP-2,4-diacetamido-2,4,6-trideoxy-beta-L-altropyranose hydrolase
MACSTPAVDKRLTAEGVSVVGISATPGSDQDGRKFTEIAENNAAEWMIVDGYQFDENYQSTIKQTGRKLMLLDDTGKSTHYFADVVLNQNVTACEKMYSNRESHTQLLLGTGYVLLRRQFATWHGWERNFPAVAKGILIALGGSDPDGLTLPVLKSLSKMCDSQLEIFVIVGGSNPRIHDLQRAAIALGPRIRLLNDVSDMAARMAEADLAIICGGGTLWEALYMGCATLTYSRPGVQEDINEQLSTAGTVIDLGRVADLNEAKLLAAVEDLLPCARKRRSMAQIARQVVDGRGAMRTLQFLDAITPSVEITE